MKRIFKMTNLIIFLVGFLLVSCKKTNSKQAEKEKFTLESYLVQDNYIKIELKKMSSGHLHVFGQLNGVNGNFILDTGAGATVIDKKNKEKFKMHTKNTDEKATGAGGSNIQIQVSENNQLKIGKLELFKQNLILMNLDHVNNAFESMGLEKADGVIGADILTKNKAVIDYSNLILYVKK